MTTNIKLIAMLVVKYTPGPRQQTFSGVSAG